MFYYMCVKGIGGQVNILAVNNLSAKNNYAQNSMNTARVSYTLPKFGLKMTAPLTQDSVSFTATPKTLSSMKGAIPKNTAIQIHKIAKEDQAKIEQYMEGILGDLLVTDYNPNNIIETLKGRPKTADSIREKAGTNHWETKEEILANMTDLNGMKIVLRDGGRTGVHSVLARFIEEIKAGRLELIEIENKRPEITKDKDFMKLFAKQKGIYPDKKTKSKDYLNQIFDYSSPEFLEEMIDAAEERYPERIVNYIAADYTKFNYPALHFLFKLPGMSRSFELQMMGHDVALYKDLDDIIYKILNNKNANPKYAPLIKIVKPLNELGNKSIKDVFNEYRGKVFLDQRSKDPRIRGNEEYTEYFLPLTNGIEDAGLRNSLDINNLYKLKLECDKKAKNKH